MASGAAMARIEEHRPDDDLPAPAVRHAAVARPRPVAVPASGTSTMGAGIGGAVGAALAGVAGAAIGAAIGLMIGYKAGMK